MRHQCYQQIRQGKNMASNAEIQRELESIAAILVRTPEGLDAKGVERELGFAIERRSLLRRLKKLHTDGRVDIVGKGPGTRYKAIAATGTRSGESSIPLSEESREIRGLLQRPRNEREPVGYNWGFLDGYEPNATFYLTPEERETLAEIGRTPAIRDLAGTYAHNILNRLLIDLSWNSSRLEGNTYSKLDTRRLIEEAQETEGKSPTEARMILNHKRAIEFMVDSIDDIGFDRRTILSLHAMLSRNLMPDKEAEGRLRRILVEIGESVYTPPIIPHKIEESFESVLSKAAAIDDPFEQSLFALIQLPYLQPFEDVNKRVSRLAANIPFIRENLSPLSFEDVEKEDYILAMLGVYELNRVEPVKELFIWAYRRSASRLGSVVQSIGEADPVRERHQEAIGKKEAASLVKEEASILPEAERAKFIELAEEDLLALHEGNFANYRLRYTEFAQWQKVWGGKD